LFKFVLQKMEAMADECRRTVSFPLEGPYVGLVLCVDSVGTFSIFSNHLSNVERYFHPFFILPRSFKLRSHSFLLDPLLQKSSRFALPIHMTELFYLFFEPFRESYTVNTGHILLDQHRYLHLFTFLVNNKGGNAYWSFQVK
jgi:hypothetical protein